MGLFEHFPYTNLHTLNLDWILCKLKEFEASLKELSDKVDNIEDVSEEIDDLKTSDEAQDDAIEDLDGRLETAEGAIGDLQTSVSGIHGIPSGGSPGQVLAKASAEDQDVAWITPAGGGSGNAEPVFVYDDFTGPLVVGQNYEIPNLLATIMYDGEHTYGQLEMWFDPYGTAYNGEAITPTASIRYVTSAGLTAELWGFAGGEAVKLGDIVHNGGTIYFRPTISGIIGAYARLYFRWKSPGNTAIQI